MKKKGGPLLAVAWIIIPGLKFTRLCPPSPSPPSLEPVCQEEGGVGGGTDQAGHFHKVSWFGTVRSQALQSSEARLMGNLGVWKETVSWASCGGGPGEDSLRAVACTHARTHARTPPAATEQSWGAHKNVKPPLMETSEGPLGTVSCKNSVSWQE